MDRADMSRLLHMFEITVADAEGGESRLLVVAASRAEARALARARGRVTRISVDQGPLAVRGGSRVIGAVASRLPDPGHIG